MCVEGLRSGRCGRLLLGEATGGERHAFQAVDPCNRTAVPAEPLAMFGRAEASLVHIRAHGLAMKRCLTGAFSEKVCQAPRYTCSVS